jgi:hypothetical protein
MNNRVLLDVLDVVVALQSMDNAIVESDPARASRVSNVLPFSQTEQEKNLLTGSL